MDFGNIFLSSVLPQALGREARALHTAAIVAQAQPETQSRALLLQGFESLAR